MARHESRVCLVYEDTKREEMTQAQAAKLLKIKVWQLRKYMYNPKHKEAYWLNGQLVRPELVKGRTAQRPPQYKERRVRGVEWIFDVDIEGEKHVVHGMSNLCALLNCAAGTLTNYLTAQHNEPNPRYINHKLTTFVRRPLPTHTVKIGGGNIGRPPKDCD